MNLPLVPTKAPTGFVQGFMSRESLVRTTDFRNCILALENGYTSKDGWFHPMPVGATSDLASTPRLMWRELPPFGDYALAAYLHDILYRLYALPEDRCNELFLEAMLWLGVNKEKADIIFFGVKEWGLASFTEDRKKQGTILGDSVA